jgi:hypothetical protein
MAFDQRPIVERHVLKVAEDVATPVIIAAAWSLTFPSHFDRGNGIPHCFISRFKNGNLLAFTLLRVTLTARRSNIGSIGYAPSVIQLSRR